MSGAGAAAGAAAAAAAAPKAGGGGPPSPPIAAVDATRSPTQRRRDRWDDASGAAGGSSGARISSAASLGRPTGAAIGARAFESASSAPRSHGRCWLRCASRVVARCFRVQGSLTHQFSSHSLFSVCFSQCYVLILLASSTYYDVCIILASMYWHFGWQA